MTLFVISLIVIATIMYILSRIIRLFAREVAKIESNTYASEANLILNKARSCKDIQDLQDLISALSGLQSKGFNTVDLYHQVQAEVRGPLVKLIEQQYSLLYARVFEEIVAGLHLCIAGDTVYEALRNAQLQVQGGETLTS